MRMTWKRAALVAVAVYLGLVVFRFVFPGSGGGYEPLDPSGHQQLNRGQETFEISRKNYASGKSLIGFGPTVAPAPAAVGSAESQKYEKIGTLAQTTTSFEDDRKRAGELIAKYGGIVQLERAVGLAGWRTLHLGIGVPPQNFDAFVEAARSIGKSTAIEIVKNDKTNEYLQLKAKRATLEKARSALEELRAQGGSTGERVEVQNRLTQIEQQIQDLGVSLGEFDSENELCTVKLTLREVLKPRSLPLGQRIFRAVQSALMDFAMLGTGFLALMLGLWLATLALREGMRLWARHATGGS
jgi:hypothetical protein